ncbi:MAG: flavodoxin domain-containing protein [Acidimicrobiia bacterium]
MTNRAQVQSGGGQSAEASQAPRTTRRRFIKSGVTVTGAAVAVGAVGTVATGVLFPQAGEAVVFPESTCGSGRGPHVLVAYASQFGTTGEVAEAIASAMCRGGATAETRRIADVGDLSAYDTVVVGGAIQYDNWMSEARDFVRANEDVLSKLPVAYFFTCGELARPSEKAEKKTLGYARKLENLSHRITPVSVGRVAGGLEASRMNLRTRFALRIVFAAMGAREGDYRDWDAIHSWGDRVLELTR